MRHQQSAHAKVHVYQQGWALTRLDQGEKVNRFSFGLPTLTLKRSVLCSQVLICRINLVLQKTQDTYWSWISDFLKKGISYIYSHASTTVPAMLAQIPQHIITRKKKPVIPRLKTKSSFPAALQPSSKQYIILIHQTKQGTLRPSSSSVEV